MYDRSRDFVSFDNSNKRYFDAPQFEVYAFFDPDCGRWCYELVDNNSFSLQDFNNGGSRLVKTSIHWCEYYLIEEILRDRFQGAIVEIYEDIEEWLDERETGFRR